MKIAVAVFVKTPGVSPLKTRLAASIGETAAHGFYIRSLKCIQEMLVYTKKEMEKQNSTKLDLYWCLGDKGDQKFWKDFELIYQPSGGLGDRLSVIYDQLLADHDQVFFVGGDCPQISSDTLLKAQKLLIEQSEFVFGPAADGGFYLFLSARPVPRKLWEDVTYSCDTTLNDLTDKLADVGRSIHFLDVEQDVDTLEDLNNLAGLLANQPADDFPAHTKLRSWIENFTT